MLEKIARAGQNILCVCVWLFSPSWHIFYGSARQTVSEKVTCIEINIFLLINFGDGSSEEKNAKKKD
jgi:hypothetical protein